jgi:hypothetical protein
VSKPGDVTKKPNVKSGYRQEDIEDLYLCSKDPMYFIKNFVYVQHPTQGKLPFVPYPFQEEMIQAFHENRFTVALTSRQMGKSVTAKTLISRNGEKVEIGSLVGLSVKERIVDTIERWILRLKA